MPGLDGTGPQGCGPMMNGAGRGYCDTGARGRGYGVGRMNRRGFQRNMQPGRMRGGFGRGRCGQFGSPFLMTAPKTVYSTRDDELRVLRDEAQDLKQMLANVESQINALETENETDA